MNAMLSEALQEFTGLLNQLMTNLIGKDADRWGREFKKFLRKEDCWVTKQFPVFQTIKLGTHTISELRQSIMDDGNQISKWGEDILGKVTLAETETEVMLHVATVQELTGKDLATNREINEAIRSNGYDLCPAEVGPQLRLQYPDQPKGEWIRVAMEPITDSDGDLLIFHVERVDAECWLYSSSGHPDVEWLGGYRFVFVSRK